MNYLEEEGFYSQELPVGLKNKDMLDELSDVQRDAVMHGDGPMVIFAGAGSGKTRIITTRLVQLMDQGVPPRRLLAVTFTNKAAREMKERTLTLSSEARYIQISTFHALCARWLRSYGDRLGYSNDFAILDTADCLKVMKEILKRFPEAVSQELGRPQSYLNAIEQAKRRLLLPADLKDDALAESGLFPPLGAEVYRRYQQYIVSANAMDFGDLLTNMVLLMRSDREVKLELQNRYRYLMVDEYQDTNEVQFELIGHLCEVHKNLVVVGDDDQSIYSWRGAKPENIIHFEKHYPGAKVVKLEHNYRCSGHIIKAARAVITNNKHRAEKGVWTENPDGALVDVVSCFSSRDEADQLVGSIRADKDTYSYAESAIFYRTNAQSRILEEVLKKFRVPYRIYGGMRFYDRAEIKDILAYLRLALNPKDNIAFARIVNVPARGLGNVALNLIHRTAETEQLSYLEAAERQPNAKVKKFVELMGRLKNAVKIEALGDLVSRVMHEIDYKTHLKKKFPEQQEDKLDNVMELGAALEEYEALSDSPSLVEWLEDAALAGSENEAESGVSLMTLHLAKGLEFERVYITGVEETLLPHQNSMKDLSEIEEERRLFYVGMTRAKKQLSLLYAEQRNFYTEQRYMRPSRFLREIPQSVVRDSGYEGSMSAVQVSEDTYDSVGRVAPPVYEAGDMVSHPTFGVGRIIRTQKENQKEKIFVDFSDFGMRKLDRKYLEKLS